MFDTAALKKTFPDLAVERRAVVGFDNVRISIVAEYFVHDLNNLFSSSTAYNLYNGKTRILVCNEHEVLTRWKRTTEVYAEVDPQATWKVSYAYRFCVLSRSVRERIQISVGDPINFPWFGIGTDLWSLSAISDVDNTVADSIGAKYIPMCHHVLNMKYDRCIETCHERT